MLLRAGEEGESGRVLGAMVCGPIHFLFDTCVEFCADGFGAGNIVIWG